MTGEEDGKGGVRNGYMATILPLVQEESGKRVKERVAKVEGER